MTKIMIGGLALVTSVFLGVGPAAAEPVRLIETGSSLLYPLLNLWVPAFAKSHPEIQITTQSTGSGAGISEAISGIAQLGASDAFMSNAQMRTRPGMLNIPLALASQTVNYHLDGTGDAHLKLSGPVLAQIYDGTVTFWNDRAITTLNSGMTLRHQQIVPVHRTDGSGDTFIFTQYLTASAPQWQPVGFGTTVSWPPVRGGVGAAGNPGMVNVLKTTPASIGYIGISFKQAIQVAGLGVAMIENKEGEFVLPDPETVRSAVEAMAAKTPADGRISLVFAPGARSYPIVNYEYAIVKADQPDNAQAKALRQFLAWAIAANGGNAPEFMNPLGFVALPQSVATLSQALIDRIK
ncbi:MAG: phosphate ABC transporter substrate-binding protein PstS [Stellaceae bacterium]